MLRERPLSSAGRSHRAVLRGYGSTALALSLALASCGPGDPGEAFLDETGTIILASHDALPAGVGSFIVKMDRAGGAAGCGSALSTFTTACLTSAMTAATSALCSGSWSVDAASSSAYASADCTGAPLALTVTQAPDPAALPFGASATVTIAFQAVSTLTVDVTFTGAMAIPANVESVRIKALRTVSPDVANCGTAGTGLLTFCYDVVAGAADFAPQMISANACSGTWDFCAEGRGNNTCGGAVRTRGTLLGQALAFNSALAVTVNTVAMGPACAF